MSDKKWTVAGEEIGVEDLCVSMEGAVEILRSIRTMLPQNTRESELLDTAINMLYLDLPEEWHWMRKHARLHKYNVHESV